MLEPQNESAKIISEQDMQSKELDDEQLLQYLTEYFRGIPKKGTKVIAMVGGPASGKGRLARKIAQTLGKTAVLATDNYLKGDRPWRRANIENPGLDPTLKYDPHFLNEQVEAIKQLQEGQELGIPTYDGGTGISISQDPNNRPDNSTYSEKVKGPQDFVIVEGDFQFLDPEKVDRLVYLDVDDQVRMENRIYRDTLERGESDIERIKANFDSRQATQFIPHTLPQKDNADLILKVKAMPLAVPTPETKFKYMYEVQSSDRK